MNFCFLIILIRKFSNAVEVINEPCTVYCSDGQRFYLPKKQTINTSLTPKILPKTIKNYPKFKFEAKPEVYQQIEYFSENDYPIYLIMFVTILCLAIILTMAYRIIKSKVKELKGVPLI